MKTVSVHLCVNDYHGEFTGCLEAVDVYDKGIDSLTEMQGPLIEDEGGEYGSTRIDFFKVSHEVKIQDRTYTHLPHTHRNHVGNIHWDSVEMEETEAKRLVSDLLAEGGWSVEVSTDGWHERDLRDVPPPVVDDGTQLDLFAEVA